MTTLIRSILLLSVSITPLFARAAEAPRSWLRARADLAAALTGVFAGAPRPGEMNAVDWSTSFRALMRARGRAHGYDVEKVMAFVVDGAIADAKVRASVDDPAVEAAVREGLTAELQNEPNRLLRKKLWTISAVPLAAMATNGMVAIGGMAGVLGTALAHHATGPGHLNPAVAMAMISISSVAALGVIAEERSWKIDRLESFVDACRQALTTSEAN